jgi:hypothetical protein
VLAIPTTTQTVLQQTVQLGVASNLGGVSLDFSRLSAKRLGQELNELVLVREIVGEIVDFRIEQNVLRREHGVISKTHLVTAKRRMLGPEVESGGSQ